MKYSLVNQGDLFRVVAEKDFGFIRKGDLGGLVESQANLSQEGNCWIEYGCRVVGQAVVRDNAMLIGNVMMRDFTKVCGNAILRENISLYGDTLISDYGIVVGNLKLDRACVRDCGVIIGSGHVIETKVINRATLLLKHDVSGMIFDCDGTYMN